MNGHLKIREIFESTIYSWGESRTPKLPVSLESMQIAPETTDNLLQVIVKPVITRSRTLAGTDHTQFSGFIQINILVPKGSGVYEANEIAEEIAQLFPIYSLIPDDQTTPTIKVQIMSPLEIMEGVDGATKYNLPVRLSYRADV
jgi:hypothetical protein